MHDLPAGSTADIHLGDAFAGDGCPLCRERARRDAAVIESMLAELVNDVGFRRELDEARGFCGPHAHAVLQADRRRSGMLATAILFRAALAVRVRELAAAHAASGRGRGKRTAEAARAPRCPLCARVARADALATSGLVGLTADPAWADAAGVAPFCVGHLVALVAVPSPPPAWRDVERRQLARLEALLRDLEGYAHGSSHDRRHAISDAQRESVAAAARLLGGER